MQCITYDKTPEEMRKDFDEIGLAASRMVLRRAAEFGENGCVNIDDMDDAIGSLCLESRHLKRQLNDIDYDVQIIKKWNFVLTAILAIELTLRAVQLLI